MDFEADCDSMVMAAVEDGSEFVDREVRIGESVSGDLVVTVMEGGYSEPEAVRLRWMERVKGVFAQPCSVMIVFANM